MEYLFWKGSVVLMQMVGDVLDLAHQILTNNSRVMLLLGRKVQIHGAEPGHPLRPSLPSDCSPRLFLFCLPGGF